jgi:protein gp37
MNKTSIPWTEYTWKIVTGCLHGCEYCYVKRFDKAMTPEYHPDRIGEPLSLKKPSTIFVANTGDLFGEWVPDDWIHRVLTVVRETPQHTYQFLTKNPAKMLKYEFPENAWVGTTVTKQEDVWRISIIKHVSAPIHFVSVEPILGKIDTEEWKGTQWVIIGAESIRNANTPKDVVSAQAYARPLIATINAMNIPLFIKPNLKWHIKVQEYPSIAKVLAV